MPGIRHDPSASATAAVRWVAISGSWRDPPARVLAGVRSATTTLLREGGGVVTGGALGVDLTATRVVLEQGLAGDRLRVLLPTDTRTYLRHLERRAAEGVITPEQARALTEQLSRVARGGGLREGPAGLEVDTAAYYARNQRVVDAADELYAFRVNRSAGTGDAIRRARAAGLPVTVRAYLA